MKRLKLIFLFMFLISVTLLGSLAASAITIRTPSYYVYQHPTGGYNSEYVHGFYDGYYEGYKEGFQVRDAGRATTSRFSGAQYYRISDTYEKYTNYRGNNYRYNTVYRVQTSYPHSVYRQSYLARSYRNVVAYRRYI